MVDYVKKVAGPFWMRKRIIEGVGNQEVLCIQDNQSCHLEDEVVIACRNWNIKLVSIPPHSSHILQPCDQGLFAEAKKLHKKLKHRILNLSEFSSKIIHFLRAYESSTGPLINLSYFAHAGIVLDLTKTPAVHWNKQLVMERYSLLHNENILNDFAVESKESESNLGKRKTVPLPHYDSKTEERVSKKKK